VIFPLSRIETEPPALGPVLPMLYHHARSPLARIMRIDEALRASAHPNTRTLAEQIGVHRRTIRRDIDYLRDQLNAPIEFDWTRNCYFYTEPSYRLPLPQMTRGEMLALIVSERMMRQFRGTPFERDLRSAITNLGEMLPDDFGYSLEPEARKPATSWFRQSGTLTLKPFNTRAVTYLGVYSGIVTTLW
jgi:predicted DNA-binding transcriptional regulator YafY